MGSKGRSRAAEVAAVQAVLSGAFSDMDVIRALHMAKDDVTAAINILLDAPLQPSPLIPNPSPSPLRATDCAGNAGGDLRESGDGARSSDSDEGVRAVVVEASEPGTSGGDWWLVGSCELAGLSTCKGRRVKAGDRVVFGFPAERRGKASPRGKVCGRGRAAASRSEIVRFSTVDCGEVGRIPNEWARCLLPLVREKKIRIEGYCKSCPDVLGIMDTIFLFVSVYIRGSVFRKQHQTTVKFSRALLEESTVHPLPTLFKLLELKPAKKAEFSPEDFYTRKRPFDTKATEQDRPEVRTPLSILEKCKKPCGNGGNVDTEDSVVLDLDLDNIVGIADVSTLEEMDPPSTLLCELRPYQKQALHWMNQLEKGRFLEDAATTLHPFWDAYQLEDKRNLTMYVNAFSGDATTNFPSTLQMSKGGILADAMGLGKTIMTIALLLSRSGRGELIFSGYGNSGEVSGSSGESPVLSNKITNISALGELMKPRATFSGGSLVICPMTLLGQWKAEIETHVQSGSLSLYVHYGQSRPKDAKHLAQNDIVLTTYGVLASEYSGENMEESGGLYSVHWFRIVLDEAHTIKSPKSQISLAVADLAADSRWCLTGTPIQNNLEDVYSLLRFLRIEPWSNWGIWLKLIQKPFEEGDERGMKLVQSILKPIMLRRTKSSTDRDGRPILVLPKADVQVVYCELSAAEKDFYDALFRRSKVKFDQFVEQGRVLHNYASILELLLRLRQCCDHPFLVMSRGDTQEFSDLNKLAKRFLKGGNDAKGGETDMPSKAYIQEVVEEIKKGEKGECPICLEACEDAVLTPCAHRLCRECLFASWRNVTSGLCPVCRKCISKQELITAPTSSRFQVDVEKNWVESSKVVALLQELKALQSSSSKSIIFSQWTAFLDLLQIALSRSHISFVRLDGTLNQQQRENVIKKFTKESDILVLLMSLKAGGVGINLTAASNAFVMDPWWNPAVEEQAVMRIHRIGQAKNVSIKRFIVKGTVEERMEAVQARKQQLIAGALTDQEMRSARIEELKMLFT